MAYRVIIPAKVQKEVNKIPIQFRRKIIAALVALTDNPYFGKKLEGKYKEEWSLKVWPYRIIYRIYKQKSLILIIRVGHRQGIY